jgi:cbb3-type cytochrome oxidase maturation protein
MAEGTGGMTILTLLIPAALFLGLLGLVAFLWSLRSGQYDDLEGAAYRALFDDEDEEEKEDSGKG